eukprot:549551_1
MQSCHFYNSAQGCRYGSTCRYLHDSTQTVRLCKYFNTATGCRYGSECIYKHETNNTNRNDNQNDIDQKSNDVSNIEQKIKTLKTNINKSPSNTKFSKYLDFYSSLSFDYHPMTYFVDYARTSEAMSAKQEGNEMYKNKKYIDAITCYQRAIIQLDCTYFIHKDNDRNVVQKSSNWGISTEKEINDLLFVILSNTAQCWLSYADSVKNKKSEKDKYILYLLYALNNTQMSLWINNSSSNIKALFRQIVSIYRLGLVDRADKLTKKFRKIMMKQDTKMTKSMGLLIQKLEKEKSNNNMQIHIQKYSQLMAKLGPTSELHQIMDIDASEKWNACNLQYLLLSITELVRTTSQYWSLLNCISWLKQFMDDMTNEFYYLLLPNNIYVEREFYQFKSYCFSILTAVLCIKPSEIAKLFDNYSTNKSMDEWEYLSNELNYIQIKNKYMWFCEQFWSDIVEHILSTKQFDNDVHQAVKKQTLLYIEIYTADERHLKWKEFYEQHSHNKSKKLPVDGRLNKLAKFNWKEGNSMEIGQYDLLNIHAFATYRHLYDIYGDKIDEQIVMTIEETRKQSKIIAEIEQVMPQNLYYMGFTWLHEFAKHGCFNACEFVVLYGMDVNIIDRVKDGGKRRYFYSDPVTPIDNAIKMLKDNNFYFAGSEDSKQKLGVTILMLRKLGGKRYCEMKNKKGDIKETKIFQSIMNGLNVDDCYVNDESDDDEFGYGGIPKYMCDELLNQGIKPWDDDAMAALSVLYDFD